MGDFRDNSMLRTPGLGEALSESFLSPGEFVFLGHRLGNSDYISVSLFLM
jgi:hypothetical protein